MVKKKKSLATKQISLNLIDRPQDPDRLDISKEDVRELAESIEERGLLQPITVAEKSGRYEIVYGDRRFLAHQLLKKSTIACVVRTYDEKEIAVDRAVENLQRVNLSVIEEAKAYERMRQKANMTDEEIGKMVSKSPGLVKRRRYLLLMPENFQNAMHEGKLTHSVAEYLATVTDRAHRDYLLEMAVEHGITLAVARIWVDDWKKAQRQKMSGTGGGVQDRSVLEEKPFYVSCDICNGPEDLNKVKRLVVCTECFARLAEILRSN